jgi:hypothetical protein
MVWSVGFVLLLFGWIMLNMSDQRTVADNCKVALDALTTCQQADTGSCPDDCTGTNGSSGTHYSGNPVYTTTTGHSKSTGTTNVDCSQAKTCTQTHKDGQWCDPDAPFFPACDDCSDTQIFNDDCPGCTTYTSSTGAWVPAPSATITGC